MGGGDGGGGDALLLIHVSVLTQLPLSQLRLPDLVKSELRQAAVEHMYPSNLSAQALTLLLRTLASSVGSPVQLAPAPEMESSKLYVVREGAQGCVARYKESQSSKVRSAPKPRTE